MIAYDSNEDSLHTGVVRFIWYAADSAHALGQLVAIDYSDSTPDVAFTYDRLGRQLTVTDVLGTRTNEYSATSLLAEHLPNGTALVRSCGQKRDPIGLRDYRNSRDIWNAWDDDAPAIGREARMVRLRGSPLKGLLPIETERS